MKKTVKIGFLIVLLAFAVTACATGSANVPLPQIINIIPPGSDVPPELAAFSGKWEGWWQRGVNAVLIVKYIDSKRAEIIYALGENDYTQKGYIFCTATILREGNVRLKFYGKSGQEFTVTIINPKKIEVTYSFKQRTIFGIMHKKD